MVGEVVLGSDAGTSGFLLNFDQGRWLAVYLDRDRLRWTTGRGGTTRKVRRHLYSPFHGDGYAPLPDGRGQDQRFCDLARELARAHSCRLARVESWPRALRLYFRGGCRVDAELVEDLRGRGALRAFWVPRRGASSAC